MRNITLQMDKAIYFTIHKALIYMAFTSTAYLESENSFKKTPKRVPYISRGMNSPNLEWRIENYE